MQTVYTYFILLYVFFAALPVMGQVGEGGEFAGNPYDLQVFADAEMLEKNENWSIAQNEQGILYVANQGGVFEFDGQTWRLIELPNKNAVFSLDIGWGNTVFVGARGEFGYLRSDRIGVTEYVSLLEHVPEEARDFSVVWGTHVRKEKVFFQTGRYFFQWDGHEIAYWESKTRLHTSFNVHDRVFVKQDNVGILEIIDDSLHVVPGSEGLASTRVFMMAPYSAEEVLIGTQKGVDGPLEFYVYDKGQWTPLDVDPRFLSEEAVYTFYHGSALREGYFVLATLNDGIMIMDDMGRWVDKLDESRSIPSDINHVFSDRQGGIWLAHHSSGISHVGTPMSLSVFNTPGIGILDLERHKGRMYVATNEGLFRVAQHDEMQTGSGWEGLEPVFVEPATKTRWYLLSYDDELLVSTEIGVFSVGEEGSEKAAFDEKTTPLVLCRSDTFRERVYVGFAEGLGIMTKTSSGWIGEKAFNIIDQPISAIVEEKDGTLWVSTKSRNNEVWRLQFDEDGKLIKHELIVDAAQLGATELIVKRITGQVGIEAPPVGVYRFEEELESYVLSPDESLFAQGDTNESEWTALHPIGDDEYWTVFSDRVIVNKVQPDGSVVRSAPDVLSLPQWSKRGSMVVIKEDDYWIGAKDELLRYNPAYAEGEAIRIEEPALIRNVSIPWSDSTLYGGNRSLRDVGETIGVAEDKRLELSHDNNDIRFDFAHTDFNQIGDVEFQYRLGGYDEGWSQWTPSSFVYYRNVDPGPHLFEVRARSRGHVLESTAGYALYIRPPWFATWWMKSIYVLLALVLGIGLASYSRARKRLVELEREREVYSRLNKANKQLRAANASLEQTNKMKDAFLANASHELRTPLTAILGFTSVLKEEVPSEHMEFLGLIDENGKRLLRTINSLLDLAKLRAGMFTLNFKQVDVTKKAEEVVDLLAQLARNRNLTLEVKKPACLVYARLDEHSFERVLYNLIGNALKFTEKGSVTVEIESDETYVHIYVRDTGIGIDEQFIPYIFDEFKQETNHGMHIDGSGLGLAISAKLVSLMKGEISVQSEKGVGSTFTIVFPVEKIGLKNRHIDEDVSSSISTQSTSSN